MKKIEIEIEIKIKKDKVHIYENVKINGAQ